MWWLCLLIKMGLHDSNTRHIITVTYPAPSCSHHAPCKLTTPPQSSNPQFLSHSRIPSLSLCLEMLIFCMVKIPFPNIYIHSDGAIIESRVCNRTVFVQVTPGASTSPDCFELADSWPEVPSSTIWSRLRGLQDKLLGENYFSPTSSLPFAYTLGGMSVGEKGPRKVGIPCPAWAAVYSLLEIGSLRNHLPGLLF